MKRLFADLDPETRLNHIQAMSEGEETLNYTKPLSREDLEEYRENLTDEMVSVHEKEMELSLIKSRFKEKLDPMRKNVGYLLGIVKAKAIEVKEDCFLIPDYENGMMEYYNSNGELVNSRRLRHEERQTTIKPLNKAM